VFLFSLLYWLFLPDPKEIRENGGVSGIGKFKKADFLHLIAEN